MGELGQEGKTTLTGRPFYYFAYGAACTEVAIDTPSHVSVKTVTRYLSAASIHFQWQLMRKLRKLDCSNLARHWKTANQSDLVRDPRQEGHQAP